MQQRRTRLPIGLFTITTLAALTAVLAAVSAAPSGDSQPAVAGTISLEQAASGLVGPLFVTHAGDGSGRLFVVEKRGTVRILRDGQVKSPAFLDIQSIVGDSGSEQGLLGMAFHPNYKSNGLFYVNYTDNSGDTIIARYQVSSGNPDAADPNSASRLLFLDQPYPNHNGGMLLFGPDGYLYVGTGDGGSAGDPQNRAQNLARSSARCCALTLTAAVRTPFPRVIRL